MRLKAPRVGCVRYLNARPLIHGWDGPVDFDHPVALARKLARGEVDAALVSVTEFLRNPIYRVVRDVAIASRGPVYSVIVAHQCDREELGSIALDPASLTSNALVRVVARDLPIVAEATELPTQDGGRLLIGDQAIHFRQQHGDRFHYWDLASAWRELTGLHFVFALWLVRPEFTEAEELAARARELRNRNMARLDDVIADSRESDAGFCRSYFTEFLRFNLGEEEAGGLREFHRRGISAGLDFAPELKIEFV